MILIVRVMIIILTIVSIWRNSNDDTINHYCNNHFHYHILSLTIKRKSDKKKRRKKNWQSPSFGKVTDTMNYIRKIAQTTPHSGPRGKQTHEKH